MHKLWLLTKINLLTFFNINKLKDFHNKTEFQKSLGKTFLILFVLITLSSSFYFLISETMPIYISLNTPYIVLIEYFAISSTMILFMNIFRINGTLFNFKDYDLLMSMPINKNIIISSKLIILYITNMIYMLVLMLPSYLCYSINVHSSFIFHLFFWITFFIIPLIPIIIATIIGSLLTIISSKFKLKNIINMILSICLSAFIIYFSGGLGDTNSMDLVNISDTLINTYNDIYPLTKLYTNIIRDYNIISLGLFIIIPIFLFSLYLLIINKYYEKINSNLSKTYTNNNYKLTKNYVKSPLIALYKKELKRYFSSYNYVLNTGFGAIMLTIASISLIFLGNDKMETLLQIPNLADNLFKYIPLILGAFCLFCCSTHSSISLEGKNLWIIKSLPVDIMNIFLSKVMVNLTILIPTILVNATILTLYLKVNLITFCFMIIIPFIYSIFISFLGLFINILFPLFDFNNEVRVIKQSLAAFLTIFIGMVVAILPFLVKIDFNLNIYILIVTLIMFGFDIILYILLNTIGKRKFCKL